jgi:MFS family permease
MLAAAMVGRPLSALGESLTAARAVFRNRDLARVELSWAGSMSGEFLCVVALGVYAYRAGGAAAVGLVGAIQLAPSAVVSPFAAVLGDRMRRELVIVGSETVRAAAMAGAAAAAWTGAPAAVVYALAAVAAVACQALYPAQTALVPLLSRSASEVTAASAASTLIRSAAGLIAPALGGLVLLAGSTALLFAVCAGFFAAAAVLAASIRGTAGVRAARPSRGPLRELLAGFGAAREDRQVSVVLALFGVHGVGRGALAVLVVVVPLELLELSEASVGFVSAAVGVGGLAGAVATAAFAGRRRLAGVVAAGLVLTGAPLMLAAAATPTAWLLVCLTVVGTGITIVSAAGTVLLVRSVRDDVLARVLGILGTVRAAAMTVGSLAAPLLVALLGVRATLVAVGVVTPVAALVARRALRRIDDASIVPEPELRLLRTSPVFAPVLPIALERLAARLEPISVTAGTAVVREGDEGDLVYLVADGRLEVSAKGRAVGALETGELFGEMALFRNQPRNATVTALEDATLYALGKEEFLAAVTGHPESSRETDDLITTRLSTRELLERR